MKPTEQDITLVERYFDAELSEAEIKIFQSRVAGDEMFRSLVEREKIIIGAIRSQGLIDTLHYLKSVEEKIQGNLSHSLTQRPKTWYYYAAAAVVTLLIAVTLLLPSQQTSDELFADYFTPYGNIFEPTVRGDKADSKTDTKRSQAFHAYERKDYQQAEILFTELLHGKQEPEILFLLGNTNLMLDHTADAQKNFSTLIRDFDDLDLQAKWYLALSYLKSDDRENARKMLRELGETENSYASKAKELIEKLD